MAAPVLQKCKNVTFGGVAITHATSFEWSRSGSEQTARGDGAVAVQLVYNENVMDRITVTALQATNVEDALTAMGNGSLICTSFTQAAGAGTTGTDVVWTWANATLISVSRGAPLDGNPTLNYTFAAAAADGTIASLLAIT